MSQNHTDVQANIVLSGNIHSSAQKLIDAAIEYSAIFDATYGRGSAVKWVKTDDGKLILFTEGQYLQTIMSNIDTVHREIFFEENSL